MAVPDDSNIDASIVEWQDAVQNLVRNHKVYLVAMDAVSDAGLHTDASKALVAAAKTQHDACEKCRTSVFSRINTTLVSRMKKTVETFAKFARGDPEGHGSSWWGDDAISDVTEWDLLVAQYNVVLKKMQISNVV